MPPVFRLLPCFFPAVCSAYDFGNPSVAEQVHLEAINQARANPVQAAQALGFDLQEGVPAGELSNDPKPPLVFNRQLISSARGHSRDMAEKDYLSHFSQSSGDSPFDRMEAAGYQNASRMGENVAYFATSRSYDASAASIRLHEDLFRDEDYPDRAHRVNLLSPKFREIGVGYAEGEKIQGSFRMNSYYLTTDFASSATDSRAFITGVVFEDADGDQAYDGGEGLGGVTITVLETGDTTTTADAGGYAIPLESGDYTLRFTQASAGSVERTAVLSGENVKLDLTAAAFAGDSPAPTDPTDPEPTDPVDDGAPYFDGVSLHLPALVITGLSVYQVEMRLSDASQLLFQLHAAREDRQASVADFSPRYQLGGTILLPRVHLRLANQPQLTFQAEMRMVGVNQFQVTSLVAQQP